MAARKNKTPAQIINYLRKAEVELAGGRTVREVCRELGVTEHTYYRWRREYGGMNTDQAKRLKELEKENQRLRRAVSDLTLDKLILTEAAKGNFIRPLSSDQWRKMVSSFASSEMHRSCATGAWRIGTPRLPHAWAAPVHATQSAPGPG